MALMARLSKNHGEVNLATVIILAFVVLPLVGLLILYRDKISEHASDLWDDVFNKGSQSIRGPR